MYSVICLMSWLFYFLCFFFFFKQKTAYEMRISDWSSDVCSSDLQDRCGQEALVQSPHDRLACAQPDEMGANDRRNDAGAADNQRQAHQCSKLRQPNVHEKRGQNHGRADRHHIGFEKVSRHARTIADIVAHIIGDNGGITRIILWNPGFHLADQVSADISGLGKDTAAKTGEDGD